jgi:energy-coupling factor transporter transmembrane protein EcfT
MFTRADELSRLLWIASVAVAALFIHDATTFAIFLVFPVLVILSDLKLFYRTFAERWKIILLLPACLLLFHYVVQTFSLGNHDPAAVTGGDKDFAFVAAGRVLAVVLFSLAFIEITDPRRLAEGLNRLGLPYKWAFAVYLGLAYVHVLQGVAGDIKDSIRIRMKGRRLGPIARLELFGRFVLLLVIASLVRAEMTSVSILSRGFAISPRRTYIRVHAWSAYGIALCVSMCCWMIVVFAR